MVVAESSGLYLMEMAMQFATKIVTNLAAQHMDGVRELESIANVKHVLTTEINEVMGAVDPNFLHLMASLPNVPVNSVALPKDGVEPLRNIAEDHVFQYINVQAAGLLIAVLKMVTVEKKIV